MPEGVEYHWMLCYVVPRSDGSADFRQKSGTITLTDETRAQAFEKLAARVADQDGVAIGDFATTFFSLEPNRLVEARAVNRCVGQHLCTGFNCPEHREG